MVLLPVGALLAGAALEVVVAEDEVVVVVGGWSWTSWKSWRSGPRRKSTWGSTGRTKRKSWLHWR